MVVKKKKPRVCFAKRPQQGCVDRYLVGLTRGRGRSAPSIADRAAGAVADDFMDRAVDLVHSSMVDRPKRYTLF
jgi:hypothetical protein